MSPGSKPDFVFVLALASIFLGVGMMVAAWY